MHWPDPKIPLEESVSALKSFQEKGLIRYWGISNFDKAQIEQFIEPNSYIPHQARFNPIHRSDDILKFGKEQNRCINCVYSPFEQGLLVSKKRLKGVESLGKKDIRRRNPYFKSEKILEWLKTFHDKAKREKVPISAMVLAWIFNQEFVDVIIIGPRTLVQLDDILGGKART